MKILTMEEIDEVGGATAGCRAAWIAGGGIVGAIAGTGVGIGAGLLAGEIVGAYACAD